MRLALGAGRSRLVRQLAHRKRAAVGRSAARLGLLLAYWLLDALVGRRSAAAAAGRTTSWPSTARVLALHDAARGRDRRAVRPGARDPGLEARRRAGAEERDRPGRHARSAACAGFFALRQVLVVAQIALSLVSLVAAGGLPAQPDARASASTPGSRPRRARDDLQPRARGLHARARAGSSTSRRPSASPALPGVTHAAVAQNRAARGGLPAQRLPRRGRTRRRAIAILVQVNSVSPGYFDDDRHSARCAAATSRAPTPRARRSSSIVNETMARAVLAEQDAIGKRFKFFGDARTSRRSSASRRTASTTASPRNRFRSSTSRCCRTTRRRRRCTCAPDGNAAALAARRAARDSARSIRRSRSSTSARSRIRCSSRWRRCARTSSCMAAFGALALLLASVGLYGVASYSVDAAHARDRRAHGARRRPRDVLGLVLGHGLLLVAVGVAIGLAVAARR